MRKLNAVLSAALLLLFLWHGVLGVLQMLGIYPGGSLLSTVLSYTLLILCLIHAGIGIFLTVQTHRAVKKSGVSYPKENRRFYAVRISGFAIASLIAAHVFLFMGENEGAFRLRLFDGPALFLSLLLLLAIAVHVILNVNPLLISLGLSRLKPFATDLLWILSVLLLLMGIGFCLYFVRWLF